VDFDDVTGEIAEPARRDVEQLELVREAVYASPTKCRNDALGRQVSDAKNVREWPIFVEQRGMQLHPHLPLRVT
jgi:hypothetical protein